MLQFVRERVKLFLKEESGEVAIEFAFTFLPVTIALIGTFETAWMMLVRNNMGNAASEIARSIRTGTNISAATGRPWNMQELKAKYCSLLYTVRCDLVFIRLTTMDTIGEAAGKGTGIQISRGGSWSVSDNCGAGSASSSCNYGSPASESGTPGSVVLFSAYATYPGLARFWNPALAHTSDGKSILMTSQLFTNEP